MRQASKKNNEIVELQNQIERIKKENRIRIIISILINILEKYFV